MALLFYVRTAFVARERVAGLAADYVGDATAEDNGCHDLRREFAGDSDRAVVIARCVSDAY